MGLKPDHWIRKMALEQRMIEPFVDKQVRQGVISYGVSSYGYDIRVADEFMIFTNVHSAIVGKISIQNPCLSSKVTCVSSHPIPSPWHAQ
jgi:deoxycytidine triphosphate deaminase